MLDRDHSVSGYVAVVISVLESQALLEACAYLAHVGGPTAVSHLRSSPGRSESVSSADHRADGRPDTRARVQPLVARQMGRDRATMFSQG